MSIEIVPYMSIVEKTGSQTIFGSTTDAQELISMHWLDVYKKKKAVGSPTARGEVSAENLHALVVFIAVARSGRRCTSCSQGKSRPVLRNPVPESDCSTSCKKCILTLPRSFARIAHRSGIDRCTPRGLCQWWLPGPGICHPDKTRGSSNFPRPAG